MPPPLPPVAWLLVMVEPVTVMLPLESAMAPPSTLAVLLVILALVTLTKPVLV